MTQKTPSAGALPDQLLNRAMLREFTPVTDTTLWRWLQRGDFPRPIKFHGRNYWRRSDISAWLEKQREMSPSAAAPIGAAA